MGFTGNRRGRFYEIARYVYMHFEDGVFTFNDLARVIPSAVLAKFKFGYASMTAMSNKGLVEKIGKDGNVWRWRLTQSAIRSIVLS